MHWTDQYDETIKLATNRWLSFLPGQPWQQWKAQLIAESGLRVDAISPVGALGIAQIMPATWEEIREALHWPEEQTPLGAYSGIVGGAWYLSTLWSQWTAPRPESDRLDLARASYNAGMGNILKAQRKADGANDAASILGALHIVTGGANAKETRGYVARIKRIYGELIQ